MLHRAFNVIEPDYFTGTFTKRSVNQAAKLRDEISYYRSLPTEVERYFPRMLEFNDLPTDTPWLTLELLDYPSLGEMAVGRASSRPSWTEVLTRVRTVQRVFQSYEFGILDRKATHQMLISKTLVRLTELPDPVRKVVSSPSLTVNGRELKGIYAQWDNIEAAVKELRDVKATLVHGDLCFSNVLYSPNGVVRLVDPRGRYGTEQGILGDARYDVAKLYQCAHGRYDFIVRQEFELQMADDNIAFWTPNIHGCAPAFREVYGNDFDMSEVLLFTAMLFASMIPLHYDNGWRQIALYLRALELFEELFA